MLQEFSQMLCVDQAYSQACENLPTFLGGKFSINKLESTNHSMGVHTGEFLFNLPTPFKAEEGTILVATLDGKVIPMRKPLIETLQDQQEQTSAGGSGVELRVGRWQSLVPSA